MKATLPIAPPTAPSAAPESPLHREPTGGEESFASVLDRRTPALAPRAERGEIAERGAVSDTESALAEEAQEILQSPEEEVEQDAVPSLMLALPLLPYQPIEQPRVSWRLMESGAPSPEPGEEGSVESMETVPATTGADHWPPASVPRSLTGGQWHARTEHSAHSAAPISAAPRADAPILAGVPPITTIPQRVPAPSPAQIVADEQKVPRPLPRPASVPHAEAPQKPTEFAPLARVIAKGPMPSTLMVADAEPMLPSAEPFTIPTAVDWSPEPTPEFAPALPRPPLSAMPHRELPSAAAGVSPVVSTAPVGAETEPAAPSPIQRHAAFLAPAATAASTLAEGAPQPDGTPAAKRGEVMPFVAIPTSPKPRVAKSAGDLPVPQGAVESQPVSAVGEGEATPEIREMAPMKRVDAAPRQTPEHRPAHETREESRTLPAPQISSRVEGQREPSASVPATSAGVIAPREAELHPVTAVETRVEFGLLAPLTTAHPEMDRAKAEAVEAAAPITRAELVQIVERTADAAVRMRATGSERIEIAVQLENGDRLTIQLQLANGEVTPHFHTNSEGLRAALEQNWTQLSDRAGDRGVRLTPPVFDVNSSSSNMTDLSQQRHGRDNAYADRQAELFPHLPRRMRPPRVLAAAPLESSSATTGGVRTYA